MSMHQHFAPVIRSMDRRAASDWRSGWLATTSGSLDGVNLSDPRCKSYQGQESRLRDIVINDHRYGISLRASL